jgi:hypothetical protein
MTTKAKTKKKPAGRTADEEYAETERHRLINKASEARRTAYYAQERRTSDPFVKRAVSTALQHMFALIFDQPFELPKPTLEDIGRLEDDIFGPGTDVRWEEIKRGEEVVALSYRLTSDVEILIHHHVEYPPAQWLLTCRPFYDKREIIGLHLADAKNTAVRMVQQKILELCKAAGGRHG